MLRIQNLPNDITTKKLNKIFENFGKIEQTVLIWKTGCDLEAKIEYKNKHDTIRAFWKMKDAKFDEIAINLEIE